MATVTLKNGTKMPMVGLGTWKSKPGQVRAAVEAAIDVGYRHIDCAYLYQNEHEIGEAIQAKINEGKVKREDLFITTKIWITFYNGRVRECLELSLKKLKLSYVDLCLMHQPFALKFVDTETTFPSNEQGPMSDESIDYVDVWKELVKLQRSGLTKEVGVSNFNEFQINRVIKETSVVPATNQIEVHPFVDQEPLVKFCQDKRIVVTGYSPFGSPDSPFLKQGDPTLLDHPVLKAIADKHGKTIAHVLLQYQLDRGIVVIPKSVTPSRIASNFQCVDFKLTADDKAEIKKLNRNWKTCDVAMMSAHKYYPHKENYFE